MVTRVNTRTVIDTANAVADAMDSKIDAECIRAATHLLEDSLQNKARRTVCFHCHGEGKSLGRPNFGYDEDLGGCRTGPVREYNCSTCKGTGWVTWEQVEARHFGARIQGWRSAQGMLLMEMADALGLSSAELSAHETGKVPFSQDLRDRIGKFMLDHREST